MRAKCWLLTIAVVSVVILAGIGWPVSTARAWLPPLDPPPTTTPPPPFIPPPIPDPLPDPQPVPPPIDPPPVIPPVVPPMHCHDNPEPSSLVLGLMGAGLFGLGLLRRRKE